MAGKVFFSVTMSLDGFMAPDAVPVEDVFSPAGRNDPRVQRWMTKWSQLQAWLLAQRWFRENLKLGEGGEEGLDNDIAPPERIVLLHGESRGDPNTFRTVLTFAPDGAATRIEMRTEFPTKELRDQAVATYHAIEGGEQTLTNLAAYVTEIARSGVES